MSAETIDQIGRAVFLTVLIGGTVWLIGYTIWREFR